MPGCAEYARVSSSPLAEPPEKEPPEKENVAPQQAAKTAALHQGGPSQTPLAALVAAASAASAAGTAPSAVSKGSQAPAATRAAAAAAAAAATTPASRKRKSTFATPEAAGAGLLTPAADAETGGGGAATAVTGVGTGAGPGAGAAAGPTPGGVLLVGGKPISPDNRALAVWDCHSSRGVQAMRDASTKGIDKFVPPGESVDHLHHQATKMCFCQKWASRQPAKQHSHPPPAPPP